MTWILRSTAILMAFVFVATFINVGESVDKLDKYWFTKQQAINLCTRLDKLNTEFRIPRNEVGNNSQQSFDEVLLYYKRFLYIIKTK